LPDQRTQSFCAGNAGVFEEILNVNLVDERLVRGAIQERPGARGVGNKWFED